MGKGHESIVNMLSDTPTEPQDGSTRTSPVSLGQMWNSAETLDAGIDAMSLANTTVPSVPGVPNPSQKSSMVVQQTRNEASVLGKSVIGSHPGAITQSTSAPQVATQFNPGRVPESEWKLYNSMTFSLSDVPPQVTTLDIWRTLQRFVENIVFIDLLENRSGDRNGIARIKVEPPLNRNPWRSSPLYIEKDGVHYKVRFQVDRFLRHDGAIKTPLKNTIPAVIKLPLRGLRFGVVFNESCMMEMQDLKPANDETFQATFDFRMKKAELRFAVILEEVEGPGRKTHQFKAFIKFSHLSQLWRVDGGTSGPTLVVPLPSPPAFFRKTKHMEASHLADGKMWNENDLWLRQTNIMDNPHVMRDTPASLHQPHRQVVDIGRWTAYCLDITEEAREACLSIERALRDYNINTEPKPKFRFIPEQPAEMWELLENPSYVETSNSSALALLGPENIHLPFSIRYQLEVCISHGVLNEHNITVPFLEKLVSLEPEAATRILEYFADSKRQITDPMTIFNDFQALTFFPYTLLPHYCSVIRKVLITPTTLYINSPTVETTNRVLRKYISRIDQFLRVQFTDELTRGRVSPSDTKTDNELFGNIYRVLKNGIRIGDRRYEFLAFGNSQIRENGAYFFCPDAHLSCDDIRAWMGNFEHIKTVAKYAARLGQCFSTTREIKGIRVPKITQIPDIERGGYCFTDGVGKISRFLAEMIAEELKLDYVPSAFQFRMGGCKGVLAVWPEATSMEVHIRKSQAKFSAIYNGLEIIRCSKFSVATLNRQTITILSSLGVPDEIFEAMLNDQLAKYDEAMQNPDVAGHLLETFVDENQVTMTMARMIGHGFMESQEPFMWTILQLWKSWSLKALKEKARIVVENGAFVLGCVDETGQLKGHVQRPWARDAGLNDDEDGLLPEIFLQVPCPDNPRVYQIIKGKCLVGRNPSIHPGDIRVVQAVDVPRLRHLKDVVVFPQLGDRDVPNMCSGGDLDGDDFFVFWDPNLLPAETNFEPMDYSGTKPQEVQKVTVDSLRRFFVYYMQNDSLAKIAHAHLALADSLEPGHVKHQRCLELAALHSKAVDYVKTGEPAEMPRRLRPWRWPHFMEKNRTKSYHSDQALGKIYDRVSVEDFEPAYRKPFDRRILGKYKLEAEILQKARRIKSQYDTAMKRLMAQKEISTEFEIWSGFVLSKPRVGTSYKVQEDIGRESSALKARFREICIKEAGSREPDFLAPFVAAMYQVTNEEIQIAFHENRTQQMGQNYQIYTKKINANSMPLISFPWLFDDVLGDIASGMSGFLKKRTTFGGQFLHGHGRPISKNASSTKLETTAPVTEERHELQLAEIVQMDYVKVGDGRVIHRGEVLDIFKESDSDDGYEMIDSAEEAAIQTTQVLKEELTQDTELEATNGGGTQVTENALVDLQTGDEPVQGDLGASDSSNKVLNTPAEEGYDENEECEEVVMMPVEESALDRAAKFQGDLAASDSSRKVLDTPAEESYDEDEESEEDEECEDEEYEEVVMMPEESAHDRAAKFQGDLAASDGSSKVLDTPAEEGYDKDEECEEVVMMPEGSALDTAAKFSG